MGWQGSCCVQGIVHVWGVGQCVSVGSLGVAGCVCPALVAIRVARCARVTSGCWPRTPGCGDSWTRRGGLASVRRRRSRRVCPRRIRPGRGARAARTTAPGRTGQSPTMSRRRSSSGCSTRARAAAASWSSKTRSISTRRRSWRFAGTCGAFGSAAGAAGAAAGARRADTPIRSATWSARPARRSGRGRSRSPRSSTRSSGSR
jgi:hypothetical protein